jgi:hypothetical protein
MVYLNVVEVISDMIKHLMNYHSLKMKLTNFYMLLFHFCPKYVIIFSLLEAFFSTQLTLFST